MVVSEKTTASKVSGAASIFNGLWHNQNSSEIELLVNEDGLVSGTFTIIESAEKKRTYSLTGFAANDLISFVVSFPRHGSITSWSGQKVQGPGEETGRIHMLWHMSMDLAARSESELWRGTLTGADVFRKGANTNAECGFEDMTPPSHPWWACSNGTEEEESYF